MHDISTTAQLLELMKLGLAPEDGDIDMSSYRYVIYARKSTESEERQVRSLSDQIHDCQDLAIKENLNVIKIITESESAKEPDIRPRFREMLIEISKGQYDGIIAWHPDRLARNMKDAGELIDLLDKKILKDLKFRCFTFQNNTMGKMLLGIAFVLSKQYSDQLSDNVKRGVRLSMEDGKYLNAPKHGYYKDRNQFLRPDPESYALIKMAFKKRLEGLTLDEIADSLNRSGYTRPKRNGSGRESITWNKKRVSLILKDTFYTGALIYGETPVNLCEIYDFVPMIEVDDFLRINKLSDIKKAFMLPKALGMNSSIKADLMRGMIICGDCQETMIAGITAKKTSKQTINYFYYRCDNTGCERRGKSVRAKVIVDYVMRQLDAHNFTSKEIYAQYVSEMESQLSNQEKEYKSILASWRQKRKKAAERLQKTKDLVLDESDRSIRDVFTGDLEAGAKHITECDTKIKEMEAVFARRKDAILDYENFLELFTNLAKQIGKISIMSDLDYMMRKFYLNFTLYDGKVASHKLTPLFEELVKIEKVLTGRGAGT